MLKNATLMMLLCAVAQQSEAQTTYLPHGKETYHLLDRLETKSGRLSKDLFSTMKPVSRKGAVSFLLEQQANVDSASFTTIDAYNMEQAISESGEWVPDEDGAIDSKKPLLKHFYRKQYDFVHVKTDNFFLVVNPVLSAQAMYEKAGSFSGRHLSSSRGFEARGWISKKVGFYTFFTDNQEQPVTYVKNWIARHEAVPGADYYKDGNPSYYDYLLARGYIDVAAIKDHLNVTFGFDKHFIGDGFRSLLLSDFSANTTFLRLNTRIWKFNYQNLFLELVPDYQRGFRVGGGDLRRDHKYASMHLLSMNVTKWLNLGIFESVVFGGRNRYEFSYLIPLIFYRSVQRHAGDGDNGNIGLTFKANAARRFQFYGQVLIDDFTAKEAFSSRGWFANKFGLQLGAKYFDAFSVQNLDLQGEVNLVRPYTYAHYDSTADYTHYNQPLAHPLGANFAEFIGNIAYQPVKNLYLNLRCTYYEQGIDTGSANYGSNIFKDYWSATSVTGDPADSLYFHKFLSGVRVNALTLHLSASLEIRRNYFIDIGFINRTFQYKTQPLPNETSSSVYLGLRVNIDRRDYTYF